jgi:hypothetical protein
MAADFSAFALTGKNVFARKQLSLEKFLTSPIL